MLNAAPGVDSAAARPFRCCRADDQTPTPQCSPVQGPPDQISLSGRGHVLEPRANEAGTPGRLPVDGVAKSTPQAPFGKGERASSTNPGRNPAGRVLMPAAPVGCMRSPLVSDGHVLSDVSSQTEMPKPPGVRVRRRGSKGHLTEAHLPPGMDRGPRSARQSGDPADCPSPW